MGAPTEAKVITPLGQVIKAQQTAKCEIVVRLNLQVQNLSLGFYLHIDKRRPGGREVSGGSGGGGGGEAASFIFQHLERFKQQKKKKSPGDAAGRLTSALPGFTGTNTENTHYLCLGDSCHSGLTPHLM